MCFGLPMCVLSVDGLSAMCEGMGRRETITLALLPEAKAGDFVLSYLGSAVRKLEPGEARDIEAAILAVKAASEGQDFEHLLSDLIDREPQLPDHLKPTETQKEDDEHASYLKVAMR